MVEFPSSHACSPMHVPLAHRVIQPACTPSSTSVAELTQDKKPMQYHSTMEAMVGSDYPVLSCLVDVHKKSEGWMESPRVAAIQMVLICFMRNEDGLVYFIDFDTGNIVRSAG
ncbi:hypothetical protein EDB86DRAFT_2833356 [Lactarius hatsudake]|nr:hypothetical protein EDB86DRAFT_2833356 [Lactarius hatsudake]